MANKREQVFLAALLHDIGKFYQRADNSFADLQNKLSDDSKRIADLLCPLNQNGGFGYQHTVWTLQFLNEIESKLKTVPNLIDNVFENDEQTDSVYQLASFHHKPSTELQALISLADWWSAGIDRRNAFELENGAPNDPLQWGRSQYKKRPLYSIFNRINGYSGNYAFPLTHLKADDCTTFPKPINSANDGLSQSQYLDLWNSFKEEALKLPSDTFSGFAESLLYLLKKYTWCIPSNTTDMSDVSLYDHLKTTAAFADCLYQYMEENRDAFDYKDGRLTLKNKEYPVLLLGGDLSGIQKFIYNITASKAAKSLKGRSFYLQLLVDSLIQKFILHKDINATLAHVLYSSGGKFYMLLPNTIKVREAIEQIRAEVERELWQEHYGQLVVNIDYVPFAYNIKGKGVDFMDLEDQSLGELWRVLAESLNSRKYQKFRTLIEDKYDELFEVNNNGGDNKEVCAVTGIESSSCKKLGDYYVLESVEMQSRLGDTLKNLDFVITHISEGDNKYFSSRKKIDVDILGIHHYLFNKEELIYDDADFRTITSMDTCRVKRVNNTDFLVAQIKGNKCSYGFQFYGGNKQATTEDRKVKTFEGLAGDTYLGVLRMDVDNLGSIFIKGLPNKSFSAYSTLSFLLDFFFSGYLNTIKEKYKDDVNILYSGGDDVFAIGKWNIVAEFAKDIREEFRRFVGRDDISISGGLAIVRPKYPIAKAAEMAGDAEKAAKDYSPQKDAFNIFGETITWGKEFDYVLALKNEFVDCVNHSNLRKSLLHQLMRYASIVKRNKISKERDLKYIWHSAYYLTRYIESTDKSDKLTVALCERLRNKELTSGDRNYELVALAARWAELEIRN